MTTKRPLRVFLCHSSNDKPAVRELYQKLIEIGIDAWLDEKKLLPGQNWEVEIPKAVKKADAVIVCLSKKSITKEGYVQKEISFALDVAQEKPENTIYIIPAKIQDCKLPERLSKFHAVNLFESHGFEFLIKALQLRSKSLKLRFETYSSKKEQESTKREQNATEKYLADFHKQYAKPLEEYAKPLEGYKKEKITLTNGMEFMRVPADKFLMGSKNKNAGDDEKPQHTVDIPYDYWMARFPVTNDLYNAYVTYKNIKHPVSGWEKKKDHPVVYVKWMDAIEYCKWLNQLFKAELPSGLILRLPTEAEWEKSARGTDVREYPWGNTFDKSKCNSSEGGKSGTTPVSYYSPQGDSPYGCADMSGNVWEWTHSLKKDYPYNTKDGREDEKDSSSRRVLRGGSYLNADRNLRCARRNEYYPFNEFRSIGFRVVCVSSSISP